MTTAPETTPAVASPFAWRQTPAGTVLESSTLSGWAAHAFTTRALTFDEGRVDADYARLAQVFGVEPEDVVRVRQVHGRIVVVVSSGGRAIGTPEADAIISTDPTRAIVVRVADCVPILLADSRRRVVAAVHAGWRGTAAGVCGAAVARIAELGVAPADLHAVVGPSIGPCCCQVDRPVREAFDTNHAEAAAWFAEDGAGKWKLDLWASTADQLERAGLRRGAIDMVRLCTVHHPEVCHSFRRDRGTARMTAAIRLGRPAGSGGA